jgi:hypothetical protein
VRAPFFPRHSSVECSDPGYRVEARARIRLLPAARVLPGTGDLSEKSPIQNSHREIAGDLSSHNKGPGNPAGHHPVSLSRKGEQMTKILTSLISLLITCMLVASLVVPVLADGNGGKNEGRDDMSTPGQDHSQEGRPVSTPTVHTTIIPTVPPIPIITLRPAKTPQPSPAKTRNVTITIAPTRPPVVPGSPGSGVVPTLAPARAPAIVSAPSPAAALKTVPAVAADTSGSLILQGAQAETVTASRMSQGAMMHYSEYTDPQGVVWGGIPLWYLVGFVDDTIGAPTGRHSSGAFNDTLAAAGYNVTITNRDGNSVRLDSRIVQRNTSYLVATTKNGAAILATDPAGPYFLTGYGAGMGNGLAGITTIAVTGVPGAPAVISPDPTPAPTPVINITPTVSPVITQVPDPGVPADPVSSSTTLSLTGSVLRNVTQSYFAAGVAAGHHGSYTDPGGNVWDGMPLWYLAGMVDDNVQHGMGAFNDQLASAGYTITVTGRSGTSAALDSRKVARNSSYIIANSKNGAPIPYNSSAAPFSLVGSGEGIGTGVQGVSVISLASAPGAIVTIAPIPTQPPQQVTPTPSPTPSPYPLASSTTLQLSGAQPVTVTPAYFTRGAMVHHADYTDANGVSWGGIPLWYLAGFVDDSVGGPSGHGSSAFSDAIADAGYTITVSGGSGSVTLDSKSVKRSDSYIIANTRAGADAPLTLVGSGAGIGGGVDGVTGISLTFGATPAAITTVTPTVTATPGKTNAGGWNISVEGKMNKIVTKSFFEGGVTAGHVATYKDTAGKTWQGIPLWYFAGLADDNNQHGPGAFSDTAAVAGYTITVYGKNGSTAGFPSSRIARSDSYLIANWMNGVPIPDSDPNAPVVLVGSGINQSGIIGDVTRIVLTFPDSPAPDPVRQAGLATDRISSSDTAPDTVMPGYTNATGTINQSVPVPIPTWTIRIAFTPLLEITIRYGTPEPESAKGVANASQSSSGNDGTTAPADNGLKLSGAITDTVTVEKIQAGINYGHKAEYTDADGNTWVGMPLWFFAGWVDDGNSHSAGAFNDDLAAKGYDIIVTGADGSEITVPGTNAKRSNSFIIATTKNGERLNADNGGPLMLVGEGVPKEYEVTGVTSVTISGIAKP